MKEDGLQIFKKGWLVEVGFIYCVAAKGRHQINE